MTIEKIKLINLEELNEQIRLGNIWVDCDGDFKEVDTGDYLMNEDICYLDKELKVEEMCTGDFNVNVLDCLWDANSIFISKKIEKPSKREFVMDFEELVEFAICLKYSRLSKNKQGINTYREIELTRELNEIMIKNITSFCGKLKNIEDVHLVDGMLSGITLYQKMKDIMGTYVEMEVNNFCDFIPRVYMPNGSMGNDLRLYYPTEAFEGLCIEIKSHGVSIPEDMVREMRDLSGDFNSIIEKRAQNVAGLFGLDLKADVFETNMFKFHCNLDKLLKE